MKKYLFILITLVTLIFAGCEKRGCPTTEEPVYIEFTAEVAADDNGAQNSVASRVSASKTTFAEGDKIGVFVVPNPSGEVDGAIFSSDNYVDNEEFTANDVVAFGATGAKTVTFPTATTKVAIYAFAMYNTRYNTLGTDPKAVAWTVPVDQTTLAAIIENDVMTAQAKGVAPGTTPLLTFAHRLSIAQLEVTTPTGDSYRGEAITGVTAKLRNVVTDAVIDMTQNSVVEKASRELPLADISMHNITTLPLVPGAVRVFEAIVPPQIYPGGTVGVTVTLTTATKSYEFDLEIPEATTTFKFVSGQRTKIPVSIDDEHKLALGTAAITPWDDVTLETIEARRPAKMIFEIINITGVSDITSATLTIDGVEYSAKTSFNNFDNNLTCVYLYDVDKFGDKLSKVTLYKGATKFKEYDYTASPINIPGNPTEEGYATVIGTLTL